MLTKEEILATATHEVELKGLGTVEIRKLKLGEINKEYKDPSKQTMELLSLSLVDPEMNLQEIESLPADIALQLQTAVLDFNGMSEDGLDTIEKN